MRPAEARDDPFGAYESTRRSSWLEDDDDDEWAFGGTVTLDPGKVLWAWERLGQDTWALEFGSVPHVMHRALLQTLKERGWDK